MSCIFTAFEVTFDARHQLLSPQQDSTSTFGGSARRTRGRSVAGAQRTKFSFSSCVWLRCLPTLFRTNRFQVTTSTVQYSITMPLTWSPKACFHPWTLSVLTNIPKADLSLHKIVCFHVVDMFQTLTMAECPLPCAQVDALHTCSARPWAFLAVFAEIRPRLGPLFSLAV